MYAYLLDRVLEQCTITLIHGRCQYITSNRLGPVMLTQIKWEACLFCFSYCFRFGFCHGGALLLLKIRNYSAPNCYHFFNNSTTIS